MASGHRSSQRRRSVWQKASRGAGRQAASRQSARASRWWGGGIQAPERSIAPPLHPPSLPPVSSPRSPPISPPKVTLSPRHQASTTGTGTVVARAPVVGMARSGRAKAGSPAPRPRKATSAAASGALPVRPPTPQASWLHATRRSAIAAAPAPATMRPPAWPSRMRCRQRRPLAWKTPGPAPTGIGYRAAPGSGPGAVPPTSSRARRTAALPVLVRGDSTANHQARHHLVQPWTFKASRVGRSTTSSRRSTPPASRHRR